ncbi:MAG TPA: hypothetical protein VN030_03230 [Cellvibrio sp.]|nr:hypothetical protein [Cellvibrio sp.]
MQLNLISDEGGENLQRFYQEALLENVQPLDRYEAYFTLGLLAWRAGKPVETYSLLNCAALEAVQIIEMRDTRNIAAVRVPDSVTIPFLVVINFGDSALFKRAASISRQQWFQPEAHEYKPLADLLDILRQHAVGVALPGEKLERLIAQNQLPGVDAFYQPWVANMAQGLLAVARKDNRTVQQYLQALLLQHEDMAFEGGWQNLVEGLMSFWATSLFMIAKKENISLDVEMFYIYHSSSK